MTTSLRPITAENWRECICLQVRDDQKEYVTPNVYSLAEGHFEPTCAACPLCWQSVPLLQRSLELDDDNSHADLLLRLRVA